MTSDPSTAVPQLFRVILPVDDIDRAAAFYGQILGTPGERVWENRHYFHCGSTILACVDPQGEGRRRLTPNAEQTYFFSTAAIEAIFERARQAGCRWIDEAIELQHWGERAFYAEDPFGNPICFVDAGTLYTTASPG